MFICTAVIGISAELNATQVSLKYKKRYGRNGEIIAISTDIPGLRRHHIAIVPYIPLDTSTTTGAHELGSK